MMKGEGKCDHPRWLLFHLHRLEKAAKHAEEIKLRVEERTCRYEQGRGQMFMIIALR